MIVKFHIDNYNHNDFYRDHKIKMPAIYLKLENSNIQTIWY